MPNPILKTHATQNLTVTAVIVGLLILVYAAFISWHTWEDEKANFVDSLRTITELEARAIDNYLLHLEGDMKSLSDGLTHHGDEIDLQQAFRVFKAYKENHAEVYNVALIRPDGKILLTARNPPGSVHVTLANETSFKGFLTDLQEEQSISIGQPLVGAISKEVIVPIRLAIRNKTGQLTYILSINLPDEHLHSFWKDAPITARAAIGLMRDNGYLLSRHPVPNNMGLGKIYGEPRTGALINHLRQQKFPESGYVQGRSSLEGPDFLNAFRRLPNYPVTAFIAMPMSEVRAAWMARIRTTYMAVLLLFGCGYAAYRYALRRQMTWDGEQKLLEDARTKLAQSLQKSEERFRHFFEKNASIQLLIDPHSGVIEDANMAAVTYYGYPREELVGLPISAINTMPPELLAQERLLAFQESTNYFQFEHRLACGNVREVEVQSTPITSNGRTVLLSTIHDITERKLAQEQLQIVLNEQKAILNSNFAGIVKLQDRQFVWMNQSFATMLGYAVEDLVGKSMRLVYADNETYAAFTNEAYPVFQRGESFRKELQFRRKDGSLGWFDICGELISADSTASIWNCTDITVRKQHEEKLQLAARVFSHSREGIGITDAQGTILDVNEAFTRITGYSHEEAVGQNPRFLSSGRQDPDFYNAMWSALIFQGHWSGEIWNRRKSGEVYAQLLTISAVRVGQGNTQHYVQLFSDISSIKEQQNQLERLKAMAEQTSTAKSDFLASMSHELRTPLNAILGFAQMLETGTTPLTPRQESDVGHILKAGWHLLKLVNEILDLTLVESGKMMLSIEQVSLQEVMLESLYLIESQASTRGITLTHSGFDTSYFVSVDRTRFKQALINLLSNAVKYNRPEGGIAIECCLRPADSIRISIRDTGEGLDPKKLAQLFQPFNRLGREAGVEEGTGIGLVVTKRLVELMGGTIGAESTVGVGSVFWIELGLTTATALTIEEDAHEAPEHTEVSHGASQRTVLYVEDNPASLALVEQLIARRVDLKLITATDGNLGVQFARDHLPDVILMDINLPGISGVEAMKILRADPSTAHIPIIALSANAFPGDIRSAIDSGFFRYLTKPINLNQFTNSLNAALATVNL
jgi:PAS domain S-box-containing protein